MAVPCAASIVILSSQLGLRIRCSCRPFSDTLARRLSQSAHRRTALRSVSSFSIALLSLALSLLSNFPRSSHHSPPPPSQRPPRRSQYATAFITTFTGNYISTSTSISPHSKPLTSSIQLARHGIASYRSGRHTSSLSTTPLPPITQSSTAKLARRLDGSGGESTHRNSFPFEPGILHHAY